MVNNDIEFEFPSEMFSIPISNDNALESASEKNFQNTDFDSLLMELNKNVSDADTLVATLIAQKEELNKKMLQLEEDATKLANDKFNFEQEIKNEKQKLTDEKIDFEQEKTKIYADIDFKREEVINSKNDFEKYRDEQMKLIEKSKSQLEDNYAKFEKIVKTFISKMNNKN